MILQIILKLVMAVIRIVISYLSLSYQFCINTAKTRYVILSLRYNLEAKAISSLDNHYV